MDWPHKILDYFWHITLPVIAMAISGFASLTMLTKNCFLDEIHKQYVLTARAKGLSEKQVLYGHVFRNAMLIVIAGFPGALLRILFTSALLIEIIFSLNGLGLLGYEAVINRDYPVMFGTLYIFTLIGLIFNLIGDLTYVLVDPRIDFESTFGLNRRPLGRDLIRICYWLINISICRPAPLLPPAMMASALTPPSTSRLVMASARSLNNLEALSLPAPLFRMIS